MFEQALIAGADFVDRRIESSKVKARELIEESQKVSIHTNLGDTFSNYADRLAYYQNPEKGLLYKRFQSFNRYLGEGILEGTLNVFMAPPGIGKSMFISYSIGDFLLQKKNVLLVSMEMSNFEFIKRIDSDLLSIPIYELKNPDRRNEITEKLESLKGNVGELYVQNYAPGAFSAYSLEALLDLYASNNIKIDVVMLDYLGLMKSDRVSPNVGLYSYIKSIGEEVRAVAKNHHISIFTASQLNRCFSINTIVKTKVGHKAAKNLCIGDEILGPNGYVKVVGISPSGVKKAYKIKTKSGKEIIVSKDHRIPTNNGLKTVDEGLKIGDRVKTSGFQSVLSKERNH
jgi:replicative DNA helicase